MRRTTIGAVVLVGALLAPAAVAAEDATWAYGGHDDLQPGQAGEVTVSLALEDPTFPDDLPVGYRHFLLAYDPDDPSSTTPMSGREVTWARGDQTGTETVDGDGAFLVPDTPFLLGSTPTLLTSAGDQQVLELQLPAGDYVLFSDLVDMSPPTSRVEGADRYATAAAASARFFRPGVDVVYLASGETFPDALAAGPLAAHDGAPLLLTARDQLPRATRDELRRLAPDQVVVVGGEVAVSADVQRELAPYAGHVDRVAGSDRYDTAARLARLGWGASTVDAAYVANGEGFPDALGASARAAQLDVPVLLVRPDGVPATTATTLDVLGVDAVTVAGGPAVVDEATLARLRQQVGQATRRWGADRYATSAALADRDVNGRTLLVATGRAFADGLTAASLARRLDADLLLTEPGSVPAVVEDRAAELAPRRVVGLGGTVAVDRTTLRAFDQLRSPLTPLYRWPVLPDGQGGAQVFTVE